MNQTPYRAIFFDLDGTLLPMELDEFLANYTASLTAFVVKHGFDGETFKAGLQKGIYAMAKHDDGKTNAEVFWNTFFQEVGEDDREAWQPLFDDFYEHDFGLLGKDVVPTPCAARAVEILKEKGYPLVLATMPMFPPRAVDWRLTWAGVDPAVFERKTNFENSTSVKPHLAYFEENLRVFGLKPEEVLMVGNNTKEDLACLQLGIDAYLITDHLLDPNDFDIETVKHGSFEDFIAWIEDFAPCANPASKVEAE